MVTISPSYAIEAQRRACSFFSLAMWPFRKDHASRLDSIQKQMLTIISGLKLTEGESVEEFMWNRGRNVAAAQKDMGKWSVRWATALLSWDAHLSRERNFHSWASMLKTVMPLAELDDRRIHNHGRPCTRAYPGFIQRRWFESLGIAEHFLFEDSMF